MPFDACVLLNLMRHRNFFGFSDDWVSDGVVAVRRDMVVRSELFLEREDELKRFNEMLDLFSVESSGAPLQKCDLCGCEMGGGNTTEPAIKWINNKVLPAMIRRENGVRVLRRTGFGWMMENMDSGTDEANVPQLFSDGAYHAYIAMRYVQAFHLEEILVPGNNDEPLIYEPVWADGEGLIVMPCKPSIGEDGLQPFIPLIVGLSDGVPRFPVLLSDKIFSSLRKLL